MFCEHALDVEKDGAGTAEIADLGRPELAELLVGDSQDDGIVGGQGRCFLVEGNLQFVPRLDQVDLRIPDLDLRIVFPQVRSRRQPWNCADPDNFP